MNQRFAALLLVVALAAPGLAHARQSDDIGIAWGISAAYNRGLETPEPPETAKDEGLCDAAWNALWRIFNKHPKYSTPAGLTAEELDWQVDHWDDRAEKAGDEGERAAAAATEALFNPWYDAGDYERIAEFAGACGLAD